MPLSQIKTATYKIEIKPSLNIVDKPNNLSFAHCKTMYFDFRFILTDYLFKHQTPSERYYCFRYLRVITEHGVL